jgi:hypothetical protein
MIAAALPASPVPTVPTVTSIPTATPEPVVQSYIVVFENKGETLFATNGSEGPISLAGLEIARGRNGRQRFSDWPPTMLPAGACLYLSRRERNATDDVNGTTCTQLVGELLIHDWRDEFTVWYNGQEIQTCDIRGERECVVVWQP